LGSSLKQNPQTQTHCFVYGNYGLFSVTKQECLHNPNKKVNAAAILYILRCMPLAIFVLFVIVCVNEDFYRLRIGAFTH